MKNNSQKKPNPQIKVLTPKQLKALKGGTGAATTSIVIDDIML